MVQVFSLKLICGNNYGSVYCLQTTYAWLMRQIFVPLTCRCFDYELKYMSKLSNDAAVFTVTVREHRQGISKMV